MNNKYKHIQQSRGNSYSTERSFSFEQLINYYPRHHLLDELLTANPNVSHINFFIDLKNIMQTTYLEFAIQYLINDSKEKGQISSLIFESFMAFLGFHKEYVLSRSLTANFYVFFETGDSGYHKRIFKDYKSNRSIDKAFGLTESELRLNRDILQKNLILINKVGNKLPNVRVFHLENLEADFIPYYLMSRKLIPEGNHIINLTYSTDHDLYQNTLCTPRSYIYYRRKQKLLIIDKTKIIEHYSKIKNFKTDLTPDYYPFFIACTGDTGDGIPKPFRGAGPATINKNLKEFVEICGGLDNIIAIASDKNATEFLDINNDNFKNINLNSTLQKFIDNNDKILRNTRLMSFEVLSRYLDNYGDNTLLEKRKYIHEIAKTDESVNPDILLESLHKTKIFIDEKHYNKLFLSPSTSFNDILKTF